MTVTTISLKAGNGNHIRKATKVTREDGRSIVFTEKMSKGQAVAQALAANEFAWK